MATWRSPPQTLPPDGAARPAEAPAPGRHASRRRHLAPASLVGLGIVATAVWLGLGVGSDHTVRFVADLATALGALLAAAACVWAASRHADATRRFWCWLAAACGAWATAELFWAVEELVFGDDVPFPSWADVGYLTALPLAALALLAHPALRDRTGSGVRALLDGLTVAAALVFCSWTFVLGPVWRDSDLTVLGRIVALAYPCGDVVIVFLALRVLRHIEGASRASLRWVLAGMTTMALADSGYAYLTVARSYETGNLIDVCWVAAYLAVALGASQAARGSEGGGAHPSAVGGLPLTPFVPMMAALLVLAVHASLGHRLDAVSWGTALVLVLLVLARLGPLAAHPCTPVAPAGDAALPAGRP